MDEKVLDELLDAFLPLVIAAETRSAAVLEALKSSGVLTDEQLAPFLEQASNAADVKTTGMRLRVKRLIQSALKDNAAEKKPAPQPEQPSAAPEPEQKNDSAAPGPKKDKDSSKPQSGEEPKPAETEQKESPAPSEQPSPSAEEQSDEQLEAGKKK